jgi:putative PIN family toxin of toxin-antitoxin system
MKHEIKTIIDCNIIISAGLTNGNCRKIVLEIIENKDSKYINYISKDIADEYLNVIRRPKFKKYYNYLLELVNIIIENSQIILLDTNNKSHKSIMNNQEYRLPDPKDEMYLHIAILTKSNYIITGNLKDFPKIDYDKVKVLSPKEFVDKIL